MKKPNANDDNNEKELKELKEKLGISSDISPDELRTALKQLMDKKVIKQFNIKK